MTRIHAVGVGTGGVARLRRILPGLPAITRHEFDSLPPAPEHASVPSLSSEIINADLLFVLAAPSTDEILSRARQIASSAASGGVLAVLLAESCPSLVKEEGLPVGFYPHPIFMVPEPAGLPHLPSEPMRHIMAALSDCLLHESPIAIDFVDVAKVLRGGGRGWVGIGTADTEQTGDACQAALQQLQQQGFAAGQGAGCFGVIRCSSAHMSAYDLVSAMIHAVLPAGADILIGVIMDEQQRGVEVTLFGLGHE